MEGPDGGDRGDDRATSSPDGSESNAGGTDSDDVADRSGSNTAVDRSEPDSAAGRSGLGSAGERPDESSSGATIEDDGLLRWFLRTDDGTVVAARDILTSVAIVAVIALVLFAVSGIWPPLVAVESGSMDPNMQKGDLIFVANEERFVGDDPVEGTGVVTLRTGAENGHEKFGKPGDVIIFEPDGNEGRTPVIHRAHFWVESGENWVDGKADPEFTGGRTCADLATCPAEYDGFVTKGDANRGYDQAGEGAQTTIVKPEWVTGKAMFRIPYLGYVRLTVDSLLWIGGGTPPGVSTGTASALSSASGAITGLSVSVAGLAGGVTVVVGRRT